jgi:uncharacterized RDD family membrane protein YckC
MAVYKFAGFWRRLVSYTIDCIIINIIFMALLIIVFVAFSSGIMSGNNLSSISDLLNPAALSLSFIGIYIFYTALFIFYFTYFHGAGGRTPGKMLLSLQVLSADATPISFGVAFLRSVGYLVSSIFCLGFIWAAFDRRKQGWHDKIAQTVVVIRPEENTTAGINIPENASSAAAAAIDEKQSNAAYEPEAKPVITTNIEDKANSGQYVESSQKIP